MRIRKRIIITAVCTMVMSLSVLSGCDKENTPETTSTAVNTLSPIEINGEVLTISDSSAEAAELSDYPIIINNTVIAEKPETAICLSSSLTEIIYELGYDSRLIGRGSYCEYPEAIKSLPDFGRPSAPDLEAVKKASPDVLITATAIPNIDAVALSDLGIKVVHIPAPHSMEEFGRIYKAVGMIFDGLFEGEEKGNKAFSDIRATLETSSLSLGNFIYVTEGLSVAGSDTFENAVLSLFGTNAAGNTSGYSAVKDISPDIQPDVVIISNSLSSGEVTSDSTLGSLSAVKSGNILRIDNSYFENPSGQIVKIIKELSETGETP